jgi:hypothetical protein
MNELVVEYQPRLVEEAVLLAVAGHERERAFHRERDRLYEVAEPEAREAAFRALHAAWFERLDLGREVVEALAERPAVAAGIDRCRVASAASSRDEMAELFVAAEAGAPGALHRAVVIRVRPARLLDSARLLAFLRRELLHIADMLDPAFEYEPRLSPSDGGPAHERLVRDRYGILWDAYVDGRLSRLGWAPPGTRAERLAAFRRAFPMLGEQVEAAFDRFFEAEALRHAELVEFAARGGRCPLCRFPTRAFEPEPDRLPPAAQERIREDFPGWEPAAGLCLQCADLYRSCAQPAATPTSPG